MLLLKLSWLNIWRHKSRSLVVILAIMLGLWAGLFLLSFSLGIQKQRTRYTLRTVISHLQIHHPQFGEDMDVSFQLHGADSMLRLIKAHPAVRSASSRILSNGMCSSAQAASGVVIHGVDPLGEDSTTLLATKLIEGEYLDTDTRNPILIGKKLAEKLKLGLRSKLVLTFQNSAGELISGAFRVSGIFKTINSRYDETQVFIRDRDMLELSGSGMAYHEIAVLLHDEKKISAVKSEFSNAFQAQDVLIQDWKELSPDLRFAAESFDSVMRIFVIIILLAMAFGIVNTMLMAVLERTHELGMLMAIGMNKRRVFTMITWETIFLTLLGCLAGLLFAYLSVSFLGRRGIDMSFLEKSMSAFGMDTMVYTYLEPHYYREILIMTAITAMLSALYPAIKAIQISPALAVKTL